MKFGQYELLEPIAIGGMAEVFKGRVVAAEGFEKYVAIKRILPDLAADERFVKMLLTEARIHSALSHRNIVQIHDLGISENGEYFIVLEYVEGYDLRVITDQLAEEREIIPEALSLYIAAELAEGLHFAHEMRGPDGQPLGLVHRDVTPSNVLISFAGEVKVSDFGLAKRRQDNSVIGSLKGNLVYMSPEQAMQAPLDRRTDIYSLGAMLFELLTGRRLREITDEIAGWNQVASGIVPSARRIRPDLPVPLERLLDKALAPNPADRFPDGAAFGVAIRDALSKLNMPVGASDLAALLSLIKPPRRSRNLMMEPSKVIRLGSEAQALGEAIAASATPAPVTPPGMTPVARTEIDRSGRFRDPAATPEVNARPPAASNDPLATPPPQAALPPARARGLTPPRTGASPGSPRQRTATPPLGPGQPGGQRHTTLVADPGQPRQRTLTPPIGPGQPGGQRHTTLVSGSGPTRQRAATPPVGAPPPRQRAATPPVGAPPPRQRTVTPPIGPGQPGQRHTTLVADPGQPRQRSATPPVGAPPGVQRNATLVSSPGQPRARNATPPVGAQPSRRGPVASVPTLVNRPPPGTPPGGLRPGSGMATGPSSNGPRPTRGSGPNHPVGDRGPLYRTPSYGVERPSKQLFAVGPTGAAPVPRTQLAFNPIREVHQTDRIQIRQPRRWGRFLFGLAVLLAGGAAAAHFYLIPLDVLASWRNPTSLSIATDPNGASLRLDGVPLSRPAPITISVQRDRSDHVLEATRPGYRSARAVVRYDRSLGLSFLLPMEKDPAAAPEPDGGTTN